MLRKKLKLSSNEDKNDSGSLEHNSPNYLTASSDETHHDLESENRSKYFCPPVSATVDAQVWEKMLAAQQNLNIALGSIDFVQTPIRYVYNPTIYACEPLKNYLELYCNSMKKVLFIGMNPGPWGMCQTGIPFGEVNMVKNWLQITGHVGQPTEICKVRKIEGFNCTRKEVSGDRFWNLFKKICDDPKCFFEHCFVYNYCPIALLKENGNNFTPAEMQVSLRKQLEESCDKTFQEVIEILQPELIVGIGRYAEGRARNIVKSLPQSIEVLYMPHPSPLSVGNNNWLEKAEHFIINNNLSRYFRKNQDTSNGAIIEKN